MSLHNGIFILLKKFFSIKNNDNKIVSGIENFFKAKYKNITESEQFAKLLANIFLSFVDILPSKFYVTVFIIISEKEKNNRNVPTIITVLYFLCHMQLNYYKLYF